MKKPLIAAATIAAALALAGCSTTTAQPAPTVTVTVTPSPEPAAPSEPTEAPTEPAAGPVEVTTTQPKQTDAEGILIALQTIVASYNVEITAPQVRAAADYVCDQLAAGVPSDQIVALVGAPDMANFDLVGVSERDYCPVR